MTYNLLALVPYIAVFLLTARVTYGRTRPSTVPICGLSKWHAHQATGTPYGSREGYDGHWDRCRSRFAAITENYQALMLSLATAAAWPAFLPVYGLVKLVTARPPEIEAEKRVRLDQLQADIRAAEAALESGRS